MTFPIKHKRRLENSVNDQDFMNVYSQLTNKYRKILVAGYIVSFLFMVFLSLFIVAFSEVANKKLSYDWIEASIVGFLTDQVLLEIVAASTIAIIIIVRKKISCCKFLVILAVLVELYRVYKNLSE